MYICIRISILVCRYITTTLVNRQFNLKTNTGIVVTDNQIRIQNFKSRQMITDITSFEHFRPRNSNTYFFILNVINNVLEANLLQIQNDVSHIFKNARYSTKFMIYTINLDRGDSKTFKR